jgi:hypothetical protein
LEKGFVITGKEALAILMLFQFTDTIRHDIKMGMEQKLLSNNVLDIFLETVMRILLYYSCNPTSISLVLLEAHSFFPGRYVPLVLPLRSLNLS